MGTHGINQWKLQTRSIPIGYVKNYVRNILNNSKKRPIDQKTPKEITQIVSYLKDTSIKDPYTKNLDALLVASFQKMGEDKAQLELSRSKAIEMSNFKTQRKLREEEAKNARIGKAIDFLMESCKKKNRGEE